MTQAKKIGIVKWYNHVRKYGWIFTGHGEPEVFVHWTGIDKDGYRSLKGGDVVEFLMEITDRGPKAVNVSVLSLSDPRRLGLQIETMCGIIPRRSREWKTD